ncbi:YitT family protein [Panacibacter ginsenosidivorans]|uniref:YitT family protein n=1 Tax=Panacibacter ginsenosidivorans TaxID=1813871 RepID=A0A5B8V953_9BACT|nr:YitT family protein [Panacibacter ginsenosidivorans]QEC67246.1 YitT family protein [Panacibacter ginsenosidivorans]
MNPFWKQVVINTVLKKEQTKTGEEPQYTSFQLAKAFRRFKLMSRRIAKDAVLMAIGIISAAFGLESFLLPNQFIDGGATGLSLLTSEVTGTPIYYLIVLINLPFIFLAYKVIGKEFAIKTCIAIIGLALCVAFIHFPEVTHDKLLVAVFGGFFLGAGIGMSVRGGAVIDGTEVLAIFLSRKLSTTMGDIIIIINVLIFSIAAYLLSVETALYSMITYLAASRTLDFVVEGIEEYTGVTIISPHHDEIREMIVNIMGRGVTVYRGRRGHGKSGETKDVDILYTVITRLELSKLKAEIERIDTNAFVVMSSVNDTKGGMIKKRPLDH